MVIFSDFCGYLHVRDAKTPDFERFFGIFENLEKSLSGPTVHKAHFCAEGAKFLKNSKAHKKKYSFFRLFL